MRRIKTKFELKDVEDDIVLLDNQVYIRHNGGWIHKKYFSTKEVATEIGVRKGRVIVWSRKLGLNVGRASVSKYTYKDIQFLLHVKNLRKNKVPLKKIHQLKPVLYAEIQNQKFQGTQEVPGKM